MLPLLCTVLFFGALILFAFLGKVMDEYGSIVALFIVQGGIIIVKLAGLTAFGWGTVFLPTFVAIGSVLFGIFILLLG